MSRICKLDIAFKHLAHRRMTSSPSTRVREVGQGVTKKGVEFRIRQQTNFRVICTVVLLIQLHENPHNLNTGLKELMKIATVGLVLIARFF